MIHHRNITKETNKNKTEKRNTLGNVASDNVN